MSHAAGCRCIDAYLWHYVCPRIAPLSVATNDRNPSLCIHLVTAVSLVIMIVKDKINNQSDKKHYAVFKTLDTADTKQKQNIRRYSHLHEQNWHMVTTGSGYD